MKGTNVLAAIVFSMGLALAPAGEPRVEAPARMQPAASAVTVSYDAEVLGWSGPLGGIWHAGQRISVSYTLDPSSGSVPVGEYGREYPAGLVSSRVAIPHLDVVLEGGPGQAIVVDDEPAGEWLFDQFVAFSPVDGPAPALGGQWVHEIGVDAFDWGAGPGIASEMVVAGGLPVQRLDDASRLMVYLRTDQGDSYVALKPLRETVTVDYEVTITEASGLFPGVFVVGHPALLSYTLDTAAENLDGSGNNGTYVDALRSVTLALEGPSLAWTGGPGLLFLYNDAGQPPEDEAVLLSYSITGTLGGEAVSSVELRFRKGGDGEPADMLGSGDLPLKPLQPSESFIRLFTYDGSTTVHFQVHPEPASTSMAELLVQARAEIAARAADPGTGAGAMPPLRRAVDEIASSWARPGVPAACPQVSLAVRSVAVLVRIRRLPPGDAAPLLAVFEDMQAALGCPAP